MKTHQTTKWAECEWIYSKQSEWEAWSKENTPHGTWQRLGIDAVWVTLAFLSNCWVPNLKSTRTLRIGPKQQFVPFSFSTSSMKQHLFFLHHNLPIPILHHRIDKVKPCKFRQNPNKPIGRFYPDVWMFMLTKLRMLRANTFTFLCWTLSCFFRC